LKSQLTQRQSNKQIRSSYKRIKSVLYNLVHSFFSLMNWVASMLPMDEFIFDVMREKGINELKIYFSKNKIYPDGEYSQKICKSIGAYMKWLPALAHSQDVDSDKIRNIVVKVTKDNSAKDACELKILVTAIDDRDLRHDVQVR